MLKTLTLIFSKQRNAKYIVLAKSLLRCSKEKNKVWREIRISTLFGNVLDYTDDSRTAIEFYVKLFILQNVMGTFDQTDSFHVEFT